MDFASRREQICFRRLNFFVIVIKTDAITQETTKKQTSGELISSLNVIEEQYFLEFH